MDVNRGVIIVKPKQPFVDWANTCDEQGTSTSLDDMSDDCSAYLVSCWESDEEFEDILKQIFHRIFENELASWSTDESQWPEKRDLVSFQEWFDIESHSVVFELGDGLIQIESFDA